MHSWRWGRRNLLIIPWTCWALMWRKNVLWLRGGVLSLQISRYCCYCDPLFYNEFSFFLARVNTLANFVTLILWDMLLWIFRSRMHYSGQHWTLILKSMPFSKFCIPGSCRLPISAQINLLLLFKELLIHMGEHHTVFSFPFFIPLFLVVCAESGV